MKTTDANWNDKVRPGNIVDVFKGAGVPMSRWWSLSFAMRLYARGLMEGKPSR